MNLKPLWRCLSVALACTSPRQRQQPRPAPHCFRFRAAIRRPSCPAPHHRRLPPRPILRMRSRARQAPGEWPTLGSPAVGCPGKRLSLWKPAKLERLWERRTRWAARESYDVGGGANARARTLRASAGRLIDKATVITALGLVRKTAGVGSGFGNGRDTGALREATWPEAGQRWQRWRGHPKWEPGFRGAPRATPVEATAAAARR